MKNVEANNVLKISAMTLGTVQLGMEYGIANTSGKPTLQKAFEVLDTAIEGGINSFDTASGYGESEEVLGKYFTRQDSGGEFSFPLLTTKFRVDPMMGTDTASIEKQIFGFAEQSLEKLKIKKIPVYMLHNAKDLSQYGSVVSDTLKKLKYEGVIEKAGVSVYFPAEVEEMLENDLYEAVQIPMNAFDTKMVRSGVLKKLRDKGCIVFVRSVFLQGLFFMDPDQMPESLSSTALYLKQLQEISRQEGLSIAQLALSFIRDMEGVTSLVIGAETPEQVADNIKLMEGPALGASSISKLEKLSAEAPIETIMKELHARYAR
jgi:aryl-alcohol dehydrogenase-like predicted oxidoreductase